MVHKNRNKWRPTLGMIVVGVLGSILLLPLASISFFRLYENQLVRQTETELIAQSAAIRSTMAEKLKQERLPELPLGAQLPKASKPVEPSITRNMPEQKWHPVAPDLDLSSAAILPPRPQPQATDFSIHHIYQSIGKFLGPVLVGTQKATLAGFRVLDFNGTVIAGRSDIGLSFAHLPEVAIALKGRYSSVLRERILNNPQPIYSISRGTNVRVFIAMPVIIDDQVAGVIYASRTPSNILKELYKQRKRIAFAAALIVSVTLLIGLTFSRAIAGPVRELTRRTKRIGDGDRNAIKPLHRHGSREVYDLSESFLQMSEKLYERNDYINNFATHVSHELKSPLTSIRGAVELLQDNRASISEADYQKFLNNILQDVDRSTLLLDRLRLLTKASNIEISGTTNLSDLLVSAINPGLDLDFNGAEGVTLAIAPENARIIFDNLLDNSRNHGADKISIDCTRNAGEVTITVADNGSGISVGNADKIFELFFTTRRQSGGTGMGLGIVRSVLEAHKGEIKMLAVKYGAAFQITLPES